MTRRRRTKPDPGATEAPVGEAATEAPAPEAAPEAEPATDAPAAAPAPEPVGPPPSETAPSDPAGDFAPAAAEASTEPGAVEGGDPPAIDDVAPLDVVAAPASGFVAGRFAVPLANWWPSVFGVTLAVLAVAALARFGLVDDLGNQLQTAGLDPDRAMLVGALLIGALGAAVAVLAGSRLAAAVVTGAGIDLIAFYQVFREETRAAMRAQGLDGTFDPLGWGLSALTLVTFALTAAWAASVLARIARGRLVLARADVVTLTDPGGGRTGAAGRLAAVVGVLLVLIVTAPILLDMVTLDPAAHMRSGATSGPQPSGGPSDGSGASPSPSNPSASPRAQVAGPAGSRVTEGAVAAGHPWSAKAPVGVGETRSADLPAPWVDGLREFATVDVYLPPGYDSGNRRYPVLYVPHQGRSPWETAIHITSLLDALVTGGQIPPAIVIFADEYGGPFPDSQCADSHDGREWFSRYLAEELPTWVDATYRTIPTAAARSLLGYASGGLCAAATLAHHPDIFGSAVVLSGSFEVLARPANHVSGRPFNDDPAIEAAFSPINAIPRLTDLVRDQIFFVLSADEAIGSAVGQLHAFTGVLTATDVAFATLPTPETHAWAAVRDQLPAALALVAARQVKLGVFDGQ